MEAGSIILTKHVSSPLSPLSRYTRPLTNQYAAQHPTLPMFPVVVRTLLPIILPRLLSPALLLLLPLNVTNDW